MRRRISLRGRARPSLRRSVGPYVRPVLFSKVKSTHTRRILCRVSGLVSIFLSFPSNETVIDDVTPAVVVKLNSVSISKSICVQIGLVSYVFPVGVFHVFKKGQKRVFVKKTQELLLSAKARCRQQRHGLTRIGRALGRGSRRGNGYGGLGSVRRSISRSKRQRAKLRGDC